MVLRRVHDVTRHGAVGDGVTDCTSAIEAAVAAAAAWRDERRRTKRAVLRFPKGGTFLTRPFNLTSELVVEVAGTIKGATGDDALRHWPTIPPLPSYGRDRDLTCTYGHPSRRQRYQALVMAAGARRIVIRGRGTIDGGGSWWWERASCTGSGCRKLRAGRPHLVELHNCTEVEVTGVTLRDSPFWTLHPVYSSHVHVHHIKLRAPMYAPNADGVNPDSSRHVLIEHNDISCGDDHVAVKAGLSEAARREYPRYLTENVTVRHNVLRAGMGISIGSETSGGVRDVHVYDNVMHGEGWCAGLHLKTTPHRGNMVERISFVGNRLFNTSGFLKLETAYQQRGSERLPATYAPTAVRQLEWINNSYAPADGRARSAWICPAGAACHGIVVVNNTAPPRSKWRCAHVASWTVSGNAPAGLEACMRRSAAAPRRRPGEAKWRKFHWRGGGRGRGVATWEHEGSAAARAGGRHRRRRRQGHVGDSL